MKSIAWGENFSERAKGYTHAISIVFRDRAALSVFADHAAHKRVVEELIKPITADLLIVDYEEKSSLRL